MTSALAFSIDDYALNSNIYLCQLPGTKGDFSFTKDGTPDGETLNILTIYEDEVVDLTRYLATSDKTVDEAKDYLKYLSWTSSNEKVAQVKEGEVRGMAPGRATITVEEAVELKQAVILINVKARPNSENDTEASGVSEQSAGPGGGSYSLLSIADMAQKTDSASGATISSIRFDYFNTLFAYSVRPRRARSAIRAIALTFPLFPAEVLRCTPVKRFSSFIRSIPGTFPTSTRSLSPQTTRRA